MTNYTIRTPNSDDIPFIYASWLNSYRYDSDIGKNCKNSVFYSEYREIIDGILKDKETRVLIICHNSDENVIYGFLVGNESTLHYCYVKEAFRRFGLGSALLKEFLNNENPSQPLVITHKTSLIKPILEKSQQFVYNPFKLYKKERENG